MRRKAAGHLLARPTMVEMYPHSKWPAEFSRDDMRVKRDGEWVTCEVTMLRSAEFDRVLAEVLLARGSE
jgi:hypothetical protein